jgi:hypothetical protein
LRRPFSFSVRYCRATTQYFGAASPKNMYASNTPVEPGIERNTARMPGKMSNQIPASLPCAPTLWNDSPLGNYRNSTE